MLESQSPDFNPTQVLLWNLKRGVHKTVPSNFTELKQCFKVAIILQNNVSS